jgi:putative membrane protein insertion efficiency factor
MALIRYPFIFLIKLYQWTIRPLIGTNCRFFPSCSEYAVEAFQKHNPYKAFCLTGKRLCKCHPFHAGGYDPVE